MMEDIHHLHFDLEGREIARNAVKQSENNEDRLDRLEVKVKNVSLINEALYEILATKFNVTETELTAMMEQVAVNRLERKDAKSTCLSCSRSVPSTKQKCMYCGGELTGDVKLSLFDQ